MILDIVDRKDPILTTKCDAFDFNEPVRPPFDLAVELVATFRHHGYPSISANEVGVNARVIALESHPALVMFNPKITKMFGEEVTLEETDLARKGLVCKVKRPIGVRVRFQDYNGDWNLEKYVGMTARLIQHAVDNIDGLTFLDKANTFHRQQALKKFKRMK